MEKIASFTVNHLNLKPGLYVSRRDHKNGVYVTTFDMRITAPNIEPVMDIPAIHTIEHLGATFLRNSREKENIVYFGPMGCRTGFYLLVRDSISPAEVREALIRALERTVAHEGDIFGASRKECGNYRELSLDAAKKECSYYLGVLKNKPQKTFEYGE